MFAFKFDKTLQVVAYLLRRESSREMNYMRLLKLVYLADRESIRQTGRPITGDHVAAMKQGPVLSEVYNLIKGSHLRYPEWANFIQKEDYKIRLICDPGNATLSRFDIEILERIAEEHRLKDEWDLVEFTHMLPEWIKNNPGDAPKSWISYEDILEALNRTLDPEIEDEAKEERKFSDIFRD